MPQADFYLLSSADTSARDNFTCRLCERVIKSQQSLAIYTQSQAQAESIDPLLWQYQPASFLPHTLISEAKDISAPIVLFWPESEAPESPVLLNLATDLPPEMSPYERLLEVVPNTPEAKQTARERYKQLKTLGWVLNTHNINA
ncbi:MAG: DNA polymerase III subunit chi [Pontibacterium sp.]